ncbi:hypothetical protein [Actinoplanes sp. NPDC026619]|uniref:MOSC domain-containing protein n=1 Tax=Actinoplanes sp. NPDC026619 TaxID=3155798 RepID=UPI00340CEFC5
MEAMQGTVAGVSCNGTYSFTKPVRDEILLIAGIGVEGDVHSGLFVKHRGRVWRDPTQPNFRQVHLIQRELFDEVGEKGYDVGAGNLGENVTTSGIDLLELPRGTILRFGSPDGAGGRVDAAGTAGQPAAGETAAGALAGVLEVAAATSLTPGNANTVGAIAAAAERDRGDGICQVKLRRFVPQLLAG